MEAAPTPLTPCRLPSEFTSALHSLVPFNLSQCARSLCVDPLRGYPVSALYPPGTCTVGQSSSLTLCSTCHQSNMCGPLQPPSLQGGLDWVVKLPDSRGGQRKLTEAA